jgi:hypothetical protein
MKSPKSILYKITILLIIIGSVVFLYWYGYHKTFDEKCIPQNTDGIAVLDVKNIRDFFVFSWLKDPFENQWITTNKGLTKHFDFSTFGIKTPDYIAFFHIPNQPVSQWFVSLKIENGTAFEKILTKVHFRKTTLQNGMSSYYSLSLNLCMVRYSNQILVSNIPETQKKIAVSVAEELFLKKHFLDKTKIEKTIDTDNAVSFWIKKNSVLEEDGILHLKLKDHEILLDGQLKFHPKYRKESQFSQNPNALLSFGFNFEMIRNQKYITDNSAKINKLFGFDLDSILAYNPTKTELILNEIVEKKDSAISYDYDDDFNPVKKVIIQTRREPSFHFSMQTSNSNKIYKYLKTQNAIDNHQVFVNLPLATTKTSIQNNALTLVANPPKDWKLQPSVPLIGYLRVQCNKLRPKDWRYIVAKNKNLGFLKSFETLEIDLSKENSVAHFQACLKTRGKKKLLSIIK